MPNKISWALNDGFVLSGFPYHDGRIVEISYREVGGLAPSVDKDLLLKILSTSGQVVAITFGRLKMLNIVEFWPSPIINDIEINREKSHLIEDRAEPGFWDILRPVNQNTSLVRRAAEIGQAMKLYEDDFFVRLYSSYGASLALICETIDVGGSRSALGPVDKPDPQSNAAEQNETEKAAISLVIAGGDAALLLEMTDEAFDA